MYESQQTIFEGLVDKLAEATSERAARAAERAASRKLAIHFAYTPAEQAEAVRAARALAGY